MATRALLLSYLVASNCVLGLAAQPESELPFLDKTGDPLFPCVAGEKWGYIDARGTWAIAPVFNEANEFHDGLAVVKIGGKCGYVDRQGNLAIQPRFDDADSFADGLAPVQVDGKWGYIDSHGRIFVDPKYDSAEPFSEGLAAVLDGTTWSFLDKTGRIKFQPQRAPRWRNRPTFSDGVCALNDSKGYDSFWSIIDTQGKTVGRFAERGPPFMIGKFNSGLAPLFFDATPRNSSMAGPAIFVGYVRKTGERVKVAEPANE